MKTHSLLGLILALACIQPAHSQVDPKSQSKNPRYVKRDIVAGRFGNAERQMWIQKAYNVKKNLDTKVIGQDGATYSLQEALIQYLETFGSRTREPVAEHIIGLPGIGKSALVNELAAQGFSVVTINMQAYDSRGTSFKINDLSDPLQQAMAQANGRPLIIVFDELDKIPEIGPDGEITQPAIGTINEILTDGVTKVWGQPTKFSNVLILTTMNFAPVEIELYAKEVLGVQKSFYEFTVEDFEKFHHWLIKNPGARSRVLSHLFRTNTVSRISPNTILFKPLSKEDYIRIARLNIEASIKRVTGANGGLGRVFVEFTDAYAQAIDNLTQLPSSGARETVFRADRLTDQLVGFATKYQDPNLPQTLDLPRKVHFDVKTEPTVPPTFKVVVTVTPQKLQGGKTLVDLPSFSFEVIYREDVRLFQRPGFVTAVAPPVKEPKVTEKPITAKEILAARFPDESKAAKGLAKKINEVVMGQEIASKHLEEDMNTYMGRNGPAIKEPSFRFIAGFPGIGKSLIINTMAEILEIPVLRIGMQQYTGDGGANEFITDLSNRIEQVKAKAKNGKYVLLIEEIDKVFEVNPQTGAVVPRPVMGIIKDLMVDGEVTVAVMQGNNRMMKTIDVRDAYGAYTMNFGADLFGFKADPRLTSAQDMIDTWERLSNNPADLKNVLSKLFLPETISRILPNFEIMKPLDIAAYAKLIKTVIENSEVTRFYDTEGRNSAQLELKLTAEYKRYLLDETVIPSEGARYTVMSSQNRAMYDIEYAIGLLKRDSPFASKPARLILDYNPRKNSVVYRISDLEGKNTLVLGKREVMLTFPRPEVTGPLEYMRALVSAHEFGHAFTAVRLGLRFELATVIPPESGTGGYVKYVDNGMSARAKLAKLYSSLGSRAMERIFFSKNPMADASVLDISSGPSSDISSATREIFAMIYQLGFDPDGGTIERTGDRIAQQPFAKFEDIPAGQLDALGKVMRKMEAQIIQDLLEAHSIEWYREKISAFGRKGLAREKEFYELVGYPYPGLDTGFLADGMTFFEKLKGVVAPLTKAEVAAMGYRQGETHTTAGENLDEYLEVFKNLVKKELHGAKAGTMTCNEAYIDQAKITAK